MIRCTRAHVDLDALQANLGVIRAFLAREGAAPRTDAARREAVPASDRATRSPASLAAGHDAPGIIAVVKANAYGHGAGRVGVALQQAGVDLLACADIEEAIALRTAGVTARILVFGALSVSDLAGLFDYDLIPTISTPWAGRAVEAAAASRGRAIPYHLKIDTGMHRLGFRHDNLARTLPDLLVSPHVRLEAVYTHFATADDPDHELFDQQRTRFLDALEIIRTLGGGRSFLVHAANSAALLRDSRTWFDYVRPGLLLYGVVPPPLATTLDLKPVMAITSRVVAVKGVRTGEPIGYGARFVAPAPMTIAVVPAGYADGLDVRIAGRVAALVCGRRVPIVGAVSMDMITLDVTELPVVPGDEVVLVGRQGDESIEVREMAAAIGTIPYEILCRVGARIERVYE